jgi:hypothetical protein
MYLSGYKYCTVGHVIKFHEARSAYGEFDHVPTGIYIPIDTLK